MWTTNHVDRYGIIVKNYNTTIFIYMFVWFSSFLLSFLCCNQVLHAFAFLFNVVIFFMWGFISEKIGQSIFCDCRNCTMNYMLWIDLNKIFSARVRVLQETHGMVIVDVIVIVFFGSEQYRRKMTQNRRI